MLTVGWFIRQSGVGRRLPTLGGLSGSRAVSPAGDRMARDIAGSGIKKLYLYSEGVRRVW